MKDKTKQKRPRCIQEILQRVAAGETDKDDADYLHAVLKSAGDKIDGLQRRVTLLEQRPVAHGQLH